MSTAEESSIWKLLGGEAFATELVRGLGEAVGCDAAVGGQRLREVLLMLSLDGSSGGAEGTVGVLGDPSWLPHAVRPAELRLELGGVGRPAVLYAVRWGAAQRSQLREVVWLALQRGKTVAAYSRGPALAAAGSAGGEARGFPQRLARQWTLNAWGAGTAAEGVLAVWGLRPPDEELEGAPSGDRPLLAAEIGQGGVLAMRCVNSAGASSRGGTGEYAGSGGGMHRVIGLGYGDPASRQLLVCELHDAGQVLSEWALDQLERIVLQTGAREWAVCASDLTEYELRQVEALAEALDTVSLTCAPRSVFHSTALEEEVALLARRDQQAPPTAEVSVVEGERASVTASDFGVVNPATCGVSRDCLAACIRLLELTKDPAQWQQFVIGELSLQSFMRLDAAALRALNVFRGDEGGGIGTSGDGGHDASLYALLNRCRTRMGAALLRRYLAQPLQDRTRIERRLNVVELLCVDALTRQNLHEDHLKRMPDLGSLCRRLASKRGTLRDVVLLYQTAVRLPSLSCALEEGVRDGCASHTAACEALEADIGRPLRRLSTRLESFSATVEKYVDLERIANHEYVVHPSVDPELGDIRAEMDTVLARIGDAYEEACSALGLKGAGPQGLDRLKLDRKDGLGYSFRVSRRDEVLIRHQPQYLVLETRKDGVRFTTPALRRLSNQYAEATARYEDKDRGIRARALELFGSYLPCFSELAAVVAELDVLVALAVVASTQQWSRPHLLEAADDAVAAAADPPGLVLRGARHPVVERWLPAGQGFIANDVDLSSPGRLAIITGPNMGGKSVAIRSVGVIVLLAHVGSFVPASHAQIPLVDQILARVGAGDQQTRGVSTFMAEMIDAAAIVRNATRNSLVIIDELGRGTSTQDGYGLAAAICEELVWRRSLALVATHFHELTQLATVLPPDTVRNYHVAAEHRPSVTGNGRDATGPLVFLYELRPGPCETSFGIHVAEMAGFPEVVLEDARQKAAQLEHSKRVLQLSRDVESPLSGPFSPAST